MATGSTERERALYKELMDADSLHDQGYRGAEDFMLANDGVVQAKNRIFATLRRRLEVLKDTEQKRKGAELAPAQPVEGGDRWSWPW